MAQERVRALDQQIAKLKRARDALKRLATEFAGAAPRTVPHPVGVRFLEL